VNFTN